MKKEIKKIVKELMVLNTPIEKDEDIQENINNNYYNQRKYVYTDQKTKREIENKVENLVNDSVQPRDYNTEINDAKIIIKKEINTFERMTTVNEDWKMDWFIENNIIDEGVQEAISHLLYEIDCDSYNLVNYANDILVVVEATMNSIKK